MGLHDSHFLPPHVRAQATETAALCALGRGAEAVVLIGDHKQLPATVLSSNAARGGLSPRLPWGECHDHENEP